VHKTRVLTGALFAFVFASALFFKKDQTPLGPELSVFEQHHLSVDRSYVFLDQFAFNFGEDIYIFSAYFTNSNDPEEKAALPFYVTSFNPTTKEFGEHQLFSGFEHVRDIQKVKTPWGEGVIIADHGFDHVARGGFLRLLIFSPEEKKFKDMSDKLPFTERIYAFNVTAFRNQLGLDDIVVAIVNMPNTQPLYLEANGSGYIDRSEKLPIEWRDGSYCFMTVEQIEISSEQNGLYLGACDRDRSTKNTSHDRVIVDEKFIDQKFMPERNSDYTWGTVFIHKGNLTEHQLDDLVILTHDYGFHRGDVKVFGRSNDGFENLSIKNFPYRSFKKRGQHYFHAVTSFDLDKDGKEDIIGTIRYLSERNPGEFKTDFSLLNRGDHFQFVQKGVSIPSNTEIVSIQTIDVLDQKQLMIFFHDGTFALYK
jgi:hypothetical protein